MSTAKSNRAELEKETFNSTVGAARRFFLLRQR